MNSNFIYQINIQIREDGKKSQTRFDQTYLTKKCYFAEDYVARFISNMITGKFNLGGIEEVDLKSKDVKMFNDKGRKYEIKRLDDILVNDDVELKLCTDDNTLIVITIRELLLSPITPEIFSPEPHRNIRILRFNSKGELKSRLKRGEYK